MELRKVTCSDCEHHLRYQESMSIKKRGVTMHFGDRFCMAEKKPRRFGRSDPKVYVPNWCPKRKSPCELRVYGFKNTYEWMMHEEFCNRLGRELLPDSWRYAVKYDLHTELTPQEFAKRCNDEPDADTIHVAVPRHYVVEVDDGIRPTFFYKTDRGYQLLALFDAETARKNVMEDDDLYEGGNV